MGAFQVGYIVGVFLSQVFVAAVVLIVAILSKQRHRPATYVVACVLVWLTAMLGIIGGGSEGINIASAFVVSSLFWLGYRAQNQLVKAENEEV